MLRHIPKYIGRCACMLLACAKGLLEHVKSHVELAFFEWYDCFLKTTAHVRTLFVDVRVSKLSCI